MSAPSRIFRVATARPSMAWQRFSDRLSMPSTASSMRWQMAPSTSSAAAPRCTTLTSTSRAGTCGKVSRLIRGSATAPTASMAIINRLAAVGWRVK